MSAAGVLSLIMAVAPAESPPLAPPSSPPFEAGEKLTYHFYWGIFMVGRGTFEVSKNEKDGRYVFTFHGKSNDFISSLYPVEDFLTSVFDLNRMRSVSFAQDRKEGGGHTSEETVFSYDRGSASTDCRLSGEKKSFSIPPDGVQDKLSTIYYMRCLDWNSRDEATVTLGNDKGNYDVTMTKVTRETVELDDFEPIPTFRVEPTTGYMSGFVKRGKMEVWVSDDKFKVPVRVVAQLPVGTVSAALVRVEGVKEWPYYPQD